MAYVYTEDRVWDRAREILAGYSGVLQVDGWGGFKRLAGKQDGAPDDAGGTTLAFCWSHARRELFVLADIAANARRARNASPISPLALEAVRRIDALFDIERAINGQSSEQRLAARREHSAPLVAELEAWMRTERARLSRQNPVAKAMDYMLRR